MCFPKGLLKLGLSSREPAFYSNDVSLYSYFNLFSAFDHTDRHMEIVFTKQIAEEILQTIRDLKDNTFVAKPNDLIAAETPSISTEEPGLTSPA